MHWAGLPRTILFVLALLIRKQCILATSPSLSKAAAAIAEDEPAGRMCLIQRSSASATARKPTPKASASAHEPAAWPIVTPQELPELLFRAASYEEKAAVNQSRSIRTQAPAAKDGLHQKDASKRKALEGSIAVLQQSIVRQSALEKENHALHTQATQAELQVARMTAADRELLRRDDLLRLEDDRVRKQDEFLRHENLRLEQAISQITRGASDKPPDAGSELELILSALAPVPVEAKPNASGNLTTNSNSSSTPASNSTAVDQDAKQAKRKQTLGILIVAATLLSIVIYILVQMWIFFSRVKEDYNEDGTIDRRDFEEYMAQKVCCGLSVETAQAVILVIIIAVGGFAFLWWQGVIQPFLKELACYLYIGIVLLSLVLIIAAEVWNHVHEKFAAQLAHLERLSNVLSGDGQAVVGDISKGIKSCC